MSERLTLQDIVDLLADKQDVTKKDSETFLRELVALISETIEGKDFVRIKDFGTFKLTPVSARRSVDVNTGDPIEIKAHYKLSFTPDKVLREGVNRPFSHFESILLDDEVVFEDKDKVEVKTPVKKEEPKAAKKEEPKKEEPKVVVPLPKKEEVVENKVVDEVLKKSPAPAKEEDLETIEVTQKDIKREEELADINTFLTKGTVDKKKAKPVVASDDSSVFKEKERPAPRASERVSKKKFQDDDDDDDYSDYNYIDEQRKKRNMWIMAVISVLILAGAGYWWYETYMIEPEVHVPVAQNNPGIIISNGESDDEGDSNGTTSTTPTATQPVTPTTTAPVEDPKPVVAEDPKPVALEEGAKEVEIKQGQTMRMLGAEYYGNGAFWVYIFEENRDRIKSPDAIFAGMKIKIAPASKYGIDANDKISVKKAEKQQSKLYGEFSEK